MFVRPTLQNDFAPCAVRTQGPDGKIRTAGARAISQSDSRIEDSGPLRCLRKKIKTVINTNLG